MQADTFLDHVRLVGAVCLTLALLAGSLLLAWYLAYTLALRHIGFIQELLLGKKESERKAIKEQSATSVERARKSFATAPHSRQPSSHLQKRT
mmetsp:Transcript_34367/g.61326  ORF Transcript_34367/g.61326 Transcript_34367/m.61326 type:complete len:93 (+) Transcript_34367:245-523(+)